MLARHPTLEPDVCDVCRFAQQQGLDNEGEHGLTRLATLILIEDLEAAGGGPARLAGLAVESYPPVDRGPIHRFDPRHWFSAIFHEPRLQLVLREGQSG